MVCRGWSVPGQSKRRLRRAAAEERTHCDPAPAPRVCKDGSAWPVWDTQTHTQTLTHKGRRVTMLCRN